MGKISCMTLLLLLFGGGICCLELTLIRVLWSTNFTSILHEKGRAASLKFSRKPA